MTLGRFLILCLTLFTAGTASALPCSEPSSLPCCLILPVAVTVPEAGDFIVGCQEYVILSSHGGGDAGTGFVLDLPPCPIGECVSQNGAGALRCLALNGYACRPDSGTMFPVIPGNRSGALLPLDPAVPLERRSDRPVHGVRVLRARPPRNADGRPLAGAARPA